MVTLPSGRVTWLFSDVEGAVRLWERNPGLMAEAMARHDTVAAGLFACHGGLLLKRRGEDDSLFAVWPRAADAVEAACAFVRALQTDDWPVRLPVRIALHSAEGEPRDGDYFGPAVIRCARLRALASGGQILLSQATQALVRGSLAPPLDLRLLGRHSLKDLSQPEDVFQLLHPALPADFPPLRSLQAFAHNLPLQLTSFVGREAEMKALRRLMSDHRLLTLVGAGGSGKTRLALQVAADMVDCYADGAWLVALASLVDPTLLPQTIASTLGVRQEPGCSLLHTLIKWLQPKSLLLLLDNCEHLIDSCAGIVRTIVQACPGVTVLASSREVLGVDGETVCRVPSLSVPEPQSLPLTERSALECESVRLLVERATAVHPPFRLSAANAPAAARICRRLDGIPLAIELAAARVKVLSLEQIDQRLSDRFRLLTGGSRTALPRQQTLRATIDWSYDLLTGPEQTLLRRLSVFSGGWALPVAEAVCTGGEVGARDVRDGLTRLVDKSLVVADEGPDGTVRCRLLETLREYLAEKLCAEPDSHNVRGRHAAWFAGLADEAGRHVRDEEQATWLDRLETEHGNLRAALRVLADTDRIAGLQMAGASSWFWYVRGYLSEGRRWLEDLLAGSDDAPATLRAKALSGAGLLAWSQGDYAAADVFHRQSLLLVQDCGLQREWAFSLAHLGLVAGGRSDFRAARDAFEQSLAIFRELGDAQNVGGMLNNLGYVANDQGSLDAARALLEESVAILRDSEDQWLYAAVLHNLGEVAYKQGDPSSAERSLRESLILRRKFGDSQNTASTLNLVAFLASARGDLEPAARIFGAVEKILDAIGAPVLPSERPDYDSHLGSVRAGMAPDAWVTARAQGRAMTLDQAAWYALEYLDTPAARNNKRRHIDGRHRNGDRA